MKYWVKRKIGFTVKTAILGVLTASFLLLVLGVVFCGVYLQNRYVTDLPDSFFCLTDHTAVAKYYAYEYESRADRTVKKEIPVEDAQTVKKSDYVPYTEFPQALCDAFVAIEDKHFYTHNGVDWLRTARASARFLMGDKDTFGASTITQQLVKNLTGEAAVTPQRKVKEIFEALEVERVLSKPEILELYLNVIHYSDGCDGIGTAAKHYFSKEVSELTPSECATLAAIVNNPTYYHPVNRAENNLLRRNLILSEMFKQEKLTKEEYENAVSKPLGLCLSSEKAEEGISSWYLETVKKDVIRDLSEKYGMTQSAASGLLKAGGLRIDIAMDFELQEAVESYYKTLKMPTNENGVAAQSSLILLDNKTGDILAVAGAVGEKTANLVQNFATETKRSPGSSIKPITVYAPALEKGIITWASVYDDTPVLFQTAPGAYTWPHNANGIYRGLTDIPYAVAHSTNTVAVKVLQDVGLENAYRMATEQFHLNLSQAEGKSDLDLAPLGLGQLSNGVTLLELTGAYTVFADQGVYHAPRSYYRVTDANGKILLSNLDSGEVVMREENAAIMTELLKGVISEGTAKSLTLDEICEVAGKTGTTGNDFDRWFVGYTPDFVCGVWCGFEYPEPLTGQNPCISIFDDVMHKTVEMRGKNAEFPGPSGIVRVSYCKDSGELLSSACAADPRGSREAIGWFVKGTEPTSVCSCHILVDYDEGVCHSVSEGSCKTALLRVERHFPVPVTVIDAQYTYRGNPLETEPNEDETKSYFDVGLPDYPGVSATGEPYN